jgi:hypothetical protein
MGGYFKDSDSTGYAQVGYGNYGIMAFGTQMGGYFKDSDQSGYALVGFGDRGIYAYGTEMGGYFKDSDNTGYAQVGYRDYGIMAWGDTMGGFFKDASASGTAYAGWEDIGIKAYGNTFGAYFYDLDNSGYVGVGEKGIQAYGNYGGGYFGDLNSLSYANVGYSSYKIVGSGAVSFVQNHPYDPSSVIVYAAPEGDEVATYTRGTARLVDGEATVPLGETFKWVTNPDIGLTAYLTPVGEWCDLYVVEKDTNEITVRSHDGSDCAFDYLVFGLRIGFEESSIVQEKEQESYIPSMVDHRQLYQRRPDLKSYNSLERFKGMRRAIEPKAELDLSRAHALRNAIVEFDPAIHELPGNHERPEAEEYVPVAPSGDHDPVGVEQGIGGSAHSVETFNPATQIGTTAIPMDAEGNVYATSFRPSSQDLASLVDVSEAVEPGDVLVIDRTKPGMMRRAFEASDNGVIGVVAASPGVVMGMKSPSEGDVPRSMERSDDVPGADEPTAGDLALRAPVAFAGIVLCKVDATYGAVWPGNLLVTSPTPGHAMRADAPLPGTMLGKALEPLEEGVGTIKVLVMLR